MVNGITATAANVTLTTTSVTPILTILDPGFHDSVNKMVLAAIPTANNGPQLSIIAYGYVTWGAGTNGVTITCTDQNGVQIGPTLTASAAAGQTTPFIAGFVDNRDGITRDTYTINLQQNLASGNGTVVFAAGFCQTPG